MKTREFTTEIYGVNFKIKGNRLCILTDFGDSNTVNWVTMPSKMAKNLTKLVQEFLDEELAESKLTPEQVTEKYYPFK